MTLEEAIKQIGEIIEYGSLLDSEDDNRALKLGIEALKWRLLMEQDYGSWCGPPLPGETKEQANEPS